MQMLEIEKQRPNAPYSSTFKCEGGLNVTLTRFLQSVKHSSPSSRTDDGKQIDCSDEQFRNAQPSIHDSFDPASKLIVKRLVQPSKLASEITSIDEGMERDNNDTQCENRLTAMRETLQSDSKVTFARRRQLANS
jgi:hypothetical protein